ncbi:hypothetical protein GA0070618_4202 [Micromonospora echinospora]|uniref:Uncharacterized protein n=1 Tax=Micromonospora echinospora TaxID=1877 RepID=A0A1C4YPE3_MICEC|nr:hypothetical protein [Micromonospora echinospora]SCF22497.1 hypothetical protein GA0070618_4202 [Micromonospora echinospora]
MSKKLKRVFFGARRPSSPSSPQPQTLMGQFLRAVMLRWDEQTQLHVEVKKHGSKDGNELTRAAFEVAVRRYFPPDTDLRVISGLVHEMRQVFGELVPVLETEMLIRAALGEEVPIDDITLVPELTAKTFTLMGLTDKWSRDVSTVNSVLAEAEELVHRRGFAPTPAA